MTVQYEPKLRQCFIEDMRTRVCSRRRSAGDRRPVIRLPADGFIRRFLIRVPPSGIHRIRHTGFLANGIRHDRISKIRRLLDTEPGQTPVEGERETQKTQMTISLAQNAVVH